jgi:metallophosphoesterase superfamily enzyme
MLHKSMDPRRWTDKKLVVNHKHPIVVVIDVTGSMGDWSKILYDKMPMFYG